MFVWIEFLLLGAVIALAGFWLSRFGDVIAERTGLSGSWIGLVLLATVTSLPELVTGVSSVRIEHAPNLAMGDALGSCLFNLLLLSVVDFFYRPAGMFTRASEGHALSSAYGIILLAIVGLNLVAPVYLPGWPFSPASLLIVLVYLLALRSIFTYERRRLMEPAERSAIRHPGVTLSHAIGGYAVAAAAVVGAGVLLPGVAIALAESMGWTRTFVGTLFLATVTSLPELVVTLSAVRIGAVDMAIANLLGSNLFNVLVLAIDDFAYPEAPLFASVSQAHLGTTLTAILMTGIVTAGLIYRPSSRPANAVGWVSVALIVAYAVNVIMLVAGLQPAV